MFSKVSETFINILKQDCKGKRQMKFQKASGADFHIIQEFYWNVIDDIHRNNVKNENLGWKKGVDRCYRVEQSKEL